MSGARGCRLSAAPSSSRLDHRRRVGPPRGDHGGQQHVGDPQRAAASPPRPQRQHGVTVAAHRAGTGVAPRAQRAGASRQASAPAARSVSARAGSTIPIIAARWGTAHEHGLPHQRREGSADVAADPARRPDGRAGSTPVTGCTGLALGLLDEWLSGRDPNAPTDLAAHIRLAARALDRGTGRHRRPRPRRQGPSLPQPRHPDRPARRPPSALRQRPRPLRRRPRLGPAKPEPNSPS
jgi:hypothetical protein